jgi:hypothetical protein
MPASSSASDVWTRLGIQPIPEDRKRLVALTTKAPIARARQLSYGHVVSALATH